MINYCEKLENELVNNGFNIKDIIKKFGEKFAVRIVPRSDINKWTGCLDTICEGVLSDNVTVFTLPNAKNKDMCEIYYTSFSEVEIIAKLKELCE